MAGYDAYQDPYNRPAGQRRRPRFGTSGKEILHLVFATVMLSAALFFWFDNDAGLFDFRFDQLDLFGKIVLAFTVAASGFVLHELAHKFTAQRFGHWSEFRASVSGLVLALAMVVTLGIFFAAPGATWHTASGRSENGKVSAAGPLVNVLVMLVAFPFTTAVNSDETLVGQVASVVVVFNGILAIFNLIPFGPLDGRKVLEWNVLFYILLTGLAVGTFVVTGLGALF